jgi:hypothetical protein
MLSSIRQWLARRTAADRATEIRELEVRGFRVFLENPYPDIDAAFVLGRLDAALALIERVQPARFRHMRRDLSKLWVTRYPCRGAYFPGERMCMTEITFLNRVSEFSDAQVAASILHEGVHARVDRMRRHFAFQGAWSRAAEERLCRRAELAFAERLPAEIAAPIVARAGAVLEEGSTDEDAAPTIDWHQAELNKRAEDLQRSARAPTLQRDLPTAAQRPQDDPHP